MTEHDAKPSGRYTLRQPPSREDPTLQLWSPDGHWIADIREKAHPGSAEQIASALNLRDDRAQIDLLEALMKMVNQMFNEDAVWQAYKRGLLRHNFMRAEWGAIHVLMDAGFAVEKDGGYELLWDKLAERKAQAQIDKENAS
ncbi:MAG: hypothetical protein ACYCSS_14970 [Sulfuriferula sp.]